MIGTIEPKQNKANCEKLCTKNKTCKFYFISENDCCALFKQCNSNSEIDKKGITYGQEGAETGSLASR